MGKFFRCNECHFNNYVESFSCKSCKDWAGRDYPTHFLTGSTIGVVKKQPPLIALIGCSASGKTTVADVLINKHGISSVNSYTTRKPRHENEQGHIFCTVEEYEAFRDAGEIVAYVFYNGNHYFSTKQQVNSSVLYVIDPIGFINLLRNYQTTRKIISVYIDTPVMERYDRMIYSGRDKADSELRIKKDATAIEPFKYFSDYVLNGETSPEDIAKEIGRILHESK